MHSNLRGFYDDFGRLTEDAVFTHRGETYLVVACSIRGFLLYRPDEWNNVAEPAYEADRNGNVARGGRLCGWKIPESALRAAIRG